MLLVVSVHASADLPNDEEYTAMHIAIANVCRSAFEAPAIQRGATIMLCDMTDSIEEARHVFGRLQTEEWKQRITAYEQKFLSDRKELARTCESLADYPSPGRFCVLTSGPGESPKAEFSPSRNAGKAQF